MTRNELLALKIGSPNPRLQRTRMRAPLSRKTFGDTREM